MGGDDPISVTCIGQTLSRMKKKKKKRKEKREEHFDVRCHRSTGCREGSKNRYHTEGTGTKQFTRKKKIQMECVKKKSKLSSRPTSRPWFQPFQRGHHNGNTFAQMATSARFST